MRTAVPGDARDDGRVPIRVVILGSTGSIGVQALDVIGSDPERFEVVGLAAGANAELLDRQRSRLGLPADRAVLGVADPDGLVAMAALAEADVVLNGVVGFAGLGATIAALEAGKRLALANKESLIAGGPVVAAARRRGGGELIPVDSEHSALYQVLRSGSSEEVAQLVVTASGGPFRGASRAELDAVTVAQALDHPTWNMGPKITVDSSTLMNKGLEVIEAHELFGVSYDAIEVVVHPQSIVHSMVTFTDGATIAQLSLPDMRLPIGLALGAPARLARPYGAIDWATIGSLTFEPPDREAFPCLDLAYAAGRAGGDAPAILSGANEVAVAAFLEGVIGWTAIAEVVDAALQEGTGKVDDLAEVLEADRTARTRAEKAIANRDDVDTEAANMEGT